MAETIPNPTPAIEAKGLTKAYKLHWKWTELVALDSLDLTIQKGQIFGLLGPNGSGKSTTFKLILGLAYPTKGSVTIAGHKAGTMAARKKLGFLPENPYFPQFLTAQEILEYYGPLAGISGKTLRTKIDELLTLVDLNHARNRRLRTFSKGMLQRIGLAQAMLHDPEILILDEPTAGVDPIGSRQIRDLMLSLKKLGKTVIFSSHLLEQVQEVCDHLAILHKGVKIKEGTLEELLTVPERTEFLATGLPPSALADVEAYIRSKGASSVQTRPEQQKLEELFIQLVSPK